MKFDRSVWTEINDVYRSTRINKNASITIDITDVDGDIFYVYPKKIIEDFLINSNFIETTGGCNLLFYPIWIDEYSNDNYLATLGSEGAKKEIELCHINADVEKILKRNVPMNNQE